MHVLVIFIFMTAVYQRNAARGSDWCDVPKSPQNSNIRPVTRDRMERFKIHEKFRFECVDGYVRKVGTSSQIRCIEENGIAKWDPKPQYPLVCIPDPRKPTIKTTPMSEQHFSSHTTEGTQTSTVLTSMSTAATEHKTFAATSEVATTKTRRTTNLPTMRMTTTEAESPTTANEIPASTSSTYASTQIMTERSSPPTQSSPFSATAGPPIHDPQISSSLIRGVTGIFIIIFLAAAASFLIWWRLKHRPTNSITEIQLYSSHASSDTYIPVPVLDSGHCSAESNAADASIISTTDSIPDPK